MEHNEKCSVSLSSCPYSKRCFITGEYCSKQLSIQRERKKLHEGKKPDEKKINAFVVMNFSNMSDVVYKWRLKPFIEGLGKYFSFNDKENKLVCSSKSNKESSGIKIQVFRADSNPSNNFVICNRVCQQMQIADLIIVDVSNANANVFYELGMAVALDKLILPICFSESYYQQTYPKNVQRIFDEMNTGRYSQDRASKLGYDSIERLKLDLEHHIDNYRWRRELFEYFCIRYHDKNFHTKYARFNTVTDPQFGFTDEKYNRFPYGDSFELSDDGIIRVNKGQNGQRIGKLIYERLRDSYNHSSPTQNTLLVYTMDNILNEAEAGQCIVNYYNSVVKQLRKENCFCGDRIGVLIQKNPIPESDKDGEVKREVHYITGDVILIGVNQAAFTSSQNTIKPDDYSSNDNTDSAAQPDPINLQSYLKSYFGNRALPVYPSDPIYVRRIKNGIQNDVLQSCETEDGVSLEHYYCLYTVMLKTLRFTNEIAVDISQNPVFSLFWLGIAHGSGIHAITIRHDESQEEVIARTGSAEKTGRNIFDVAGLWTAVFRSNDTEGFYRQLAQAQSGIEQRTKLLLPNREEYNEKLQDAFWNPYPETVSEIPKDHMEKEKDENKALESYYRDQFWTRMLRYNSLWIYLPKVDDTNIKDKEPRTHAVKWDVCAIAELSHYLSKRKIIGEYRFEMIGINDADKESEHKNFICVGKDAKPLSLDNCPAPLAEYINRKQSITSHDETSHDDIPYLIPIGKELTIKNECPAKELTFKGFITNEGKGTRFFTQTSRYSCYPCIGLNAGSSQAQDLFRTFEEVSIVPCTIKHKYEHWQLGQIIMWRERPENPNNGRVQFWVSIVGASGPATLALSSLFIDDPQRNDLFSRDESDLENSFHLLVFQEKVRKQFLAKFDALLEKIGLDSFDSLIYRAATMYLRATLYRFFLPFLTFEDEHRIVNGMNYFLSSLKSVLPTEDKYTQDEAKRISDALNETIENLRGVEAMYRVEVKIPTDECKVKQGNHGEGTIGRDERRIVKIEPIDAGMEVTSTSDEPKSIHVLFWEPQSESDSNL